MHKVPHSESGREAGPPELTVSLSRWALPRTAVRVALEGLTPEGFQRVSGQQQHSHPVKSAAHTHTRTQAESAWQLRQLGG